MRNIGIGLALIAAVSGVTEAQADGPALGNNRITQAQITSGTLTIQQLRRAGLVVFSTPFNAMDGFGDGPDVNPADPKSPGGRPTINGTWLRVNGMDSQSCIECHFARGTNTIPMTFAVGGTGGIAASAFPGIQNFDLADTNGDDIANIDGRIINPPFIFGSGGVELVGNEMTADLQARKATAMANPGTVVQLNTKGVNFGSISYDGSDFDTSNVEGINDDLVVRPFGRKGDNSSIRKFDTGAMMFHHGMQPAEIVGDGVDGDNDGVADEILVGELSALHIFSTSMERPVRIGRFSNPSQSQLFVSTGCADCHTPVMQTNSTNLGLTFPEVETDPSANVYLNIDLTATAGFVANVFGGVRVELFSDLKRHDMGPELAETTGGALDPFYITPRLWGVADSAPYMHDGRSLTIRDAILAHGGEGAAASQQFAALAPSQQNLIIGFLGRLRSPAKPSSDISDPVRVR